MSKNNTLLGKLRHHVSGAIERGEAQPIEAVVEKQAIKLDYSLIDDIEIDGIDTRDYPDFCDAFISYATYNGRDMTDEELELLNDDRDYVYEQVQNRLY